MKVIFFNIWHGKVWEELKSFLESHVADTDVFCLTEVHPALHAELTEILGDFQPYYEEIAKVDFHDPGVDGQSIFIKSGISVESFGKEFLYDVSRTDAGGLQHVELNINGKKLFVGNIHGKAQPGTKEDTPIRLEQSARILKFFKDKNGSKIFGGDFNLNPDTKSIKMLEDGGFRNLIKEFNIDNTRDELSWEQFGNTPQHFADYAFVSPEIKVTSFEVPYIEISDHLPLVLDFEI